MFRFRFIPRRGRICPWSERKLAMMIISCADCHARTVDFCDLVVSESEGDLVRFAVSPAPVGSKCGLCEYDANN